MLLLQAINTSQLAGTVGMWQAEALCHDYPIVATLH
jgi:hypothetical protein